MRTQKDPSLSPLAVCFPVGVSMETSGEDGTGGGVAMGTDGQCACLCESVQVPCSTSVCAVRVASWSFLYFSGRSRSMACGKQSGGRERRAQQQNNREADWLNIRAVAVINYGKAGFQPFRFHLRKANFNAFLGILRDGPTQRTKACHDNKLCYPKCP